MPWTRRWQSRGTHIAGADPEELDVIRGTAGIQRARVFLQFRGDAGIADHLSCVHAPESYVLHRVVLLPRLPLLATQALHLPLPDLYATLRPVMRLSRGICNTA
jgi:hypothetical protein